MKQSVREALDAYYHEAGSWAEDRIAHLRKSRQTAWIVAGIALIAALSEALAILAIMPLKTVVPYTLLVDRQTGYVQELKPLDQEKLSPDTALTRSFLVQYVIARESFAIDELQTNYRKIMLWSASAARSDYSAMIQVGNPASPLVRYPRSTLVETRVKSVSSLNGGAALVRFDTVRRDANGRASEPQPWVVIINYRFSTGPLRTDDRFLNPLGFQVTRYRRDQEALVPDENGSFGGKSQVLPLPASNPPSATGPIGPAR